MIKQKHTPGQLKIDDVTAHFAYLLVPGTDVARIDMTRERGPEDAMRLMECWNACEGIADPSALSQLLEVAKLVLKMRTAMRIEREVMPKSYEAPLSVDAIGIVIEHAIRAIAKAEGLE